MYGSDRLPGQDAFRSNENRFGDAAFHESAPSPHESCGVDRRAGVEASRFAISAVGGGWRKLVVLALLCLPLAGYAGDGVKYTDHWKSLGVSATDIDLIDKLDLKKSKVEMLITSGVSVREYSHRPWEPMGITEDQWISQLQHGSTIGQMERMYSRDHDAPEIDRPNIVGAILLPGLPQLREGRTVPGCILSGLGVSFAALLVVNIAKSQGSAIQIWAPLLGLDMFASGADVWYNHYREQSVTGFSLNLQPRPSGMGAVLAARF
jgi:hypothetical protein